MRRTRKITDRALTSLARNGAVGDEIKDTEIPGFHVRLSKRGAVFRLYYRSPVTRKQRKATLGTYGPQCDVALARQWATEMLQDIYAGQDPNESKAAARREQEQQANEIRTLADYLEGPYQAYQARRKSGQETLNRLRRDFASLLDAEMANLARRHVVEWQASMEKAGKAHSTIKRSYGALQTLLNQAVRDEVLEANPLQGVQLDKPPAPAQGELLEEGAGKRRYLTDREVAFLFAGVEAYQTEKRRQRANSRAHGKGHLPNLDQIPYVDYAPPFVLTMYYTGLRPGDLFGLRWEHLSFAWRRLRKVVEKTAHLHPEPTTFPLSDAVVAVLKEWWTQQGSPMTGYVFPDASGGRRHYQSMRKPWRRIKELGGLPQDLDLYTLRHNFASQLVMQGVDLATVSRLMGHRDIHTTIRFYGHLAPDHALEAANRFAGQTPGVGEKGRGKVGGP